MRPGKESAGNGRHGQKKRHRGSGASATSALGRPPLGDDHDRAELGGAIVRSHHRLDPRRHRGRHRRRYAALHGRRLTGARWPPAARGTTPRRLADHPPSRRHTVISATVC
jgi:hypothetical protein